MNEELQELRRRVEALEREVAALKAGAPLPVHSAAAPTSPIAAQPAPLPQSPPEPTPTPATSGHSRMETEVAGIWFNRIAVVLLTLATLYGFKWAVDNDYVGPGGRVALGFLCGLAALAVGRYTWDRGYKGWSLGVTGGGIALFYISTFAAYQWYQLIPHAAAFTLMVLFVLLSAFLSLWYDAVAVAWLGALGGFLTPFLLHTGSSNILGLFSYVTLLNFGILGLAAFRKWRSLTVLGFSATWLTWCVGFFSASGSQWPTAFVFAALFFLIFTFAAFFYNLRHREEPVLSDLLLLGFGGLVYFGAGLSLLHENNMQAWSGFFATAVAIVYFGLAQLTAKRFPKGEMLTHSLLGLGVAFLTIAIAVQLSGAWVTIGWAVEGAVLVAVGLRGRIRRIRLAGLGVLGLAVVRLLEASDYHGPAGDTLQAFLRRDVGFATVVAALVAALWLYRRYTEGVEDQERRSFGGLLGIACSLLILYWIHLDVTALIPKQPAMRHFVTSVTWAAFGFGLLAAGFARRMRGARLLGIGVLALTLGKLGLVDFMTLRGGWRVIGLFALGLVLLAASYLYFRFKDRITAAEEAQA